MGQAKFEVSNELLVSYLRLPVGTRIIGIGMTEPWKTDVVMVAVEHEDLPKNVEGCLYATCHPQVSMHTVDGVVEYRFEGWGI